ncbi:MAG: phospholipase D-like domain-containing protein [Nocardioidaceae bacterium]
MQRRPGRRTLASATAVLVASSVALVVPVTATASPVRSTGVSGAIVVQAPASKADRARRAAVLKVRRERRARWAKVRVHRPATWIRTSVGHTTPAPGPHFNNPYGSRASERALLDQVIAAIDGSPGYRRPVDPGTHRPVACPTSPRAFPSRIRIAVYSIADRHVAEAVVAAQQRCVSVQILMNSHLTAVTSPSWGMIARALGPRGPEPARQRSFAHRCSNGCLGSAVLHSKLFLFSHAGRSRDTVMVGSSNMARNATDIQWNDLYTVNGNRRLYAEYAGVFSRMAPDVRGGGPRVYRAGPYTSTFYPFRRATSRTDLTMRALRSIRCSGATGGAGIGGHSVLYVAMHSWHGVRGRYLAERVRQMYDRGCFVRILYSFMSYDVYSLLRSGSGRRMTVRRVLFPGPKGVVAAKYAHLKMFAASGRVAGDRSSWVTWTGSNNWTDRGTRSDEVTLRIPSAAVYAAYVRQWKVIRHRRSSPVWATFLEPTGGGRAP